MAGRIRPGTWAWSRGAAPAATLALFLLLLVVETPFGTATAQARGWIGVSVQDLTEGLRDAMGLSARSGALVSDVVEGGPADDADIRPKDVILRVEDRVIEDADDLVEFLAAKDEGDRVQLRILRGDREMDIDVTLGDQPARGDVERLHPPIPGFPPVPGAPDAEGAPVPPWPSPRVRVERQGSGLGVTVHDLDRNLAPYFKTDAGRGLLVLSVQDDSPAEKAGIESGDVILTFNGERIGSVDELRDGVRSLSPGDDWKAVVLRQGREHEIRGRMERGWREPLDLGNSGMLKRFRSERELDRDPGGLERGEDGQRMRDLEHALRDLQRKLERLEKRLERRLRD